MKKNMAVALAALLLVLPGAYADDGSVAAKEWAGYMETLAPLGERLVKKMPDADDPQMRAEMYKQIYSAIAHGYFGTVYADAEYPDFVPYFNQALNYLAPNPDDVYYETPVQGDGVYKISGFRGTVRYVNFTIGSGTLTPYGSGAFGPTLADHDIDELKINKKDGSFEVLLSNERPKNYTGDWWQLDPKTTNILVRQISYDWLHEVDARLAIERLDRPAAKPRQSAAEIEKRLKHVAEWAESWSSIWLDRDADLINKLAIHDLNALGGLTTQQYYEGRFDVGPDEALILETAVPKKCRYWNVELTNMLWSAVDYLNRQSNLNGFTAKVDKDGKFRAVISAQDPGVPNWLDNGGYTKGYVFGRWTVCDSHPIPTLTKVKLADVRKYLPDDTPAVTAEAREAALRLRRKGAQLRRRW